jgi:hypothetical protein
VCRFVTATLPQSAPHAALDALARRWSRQFLRLHSPELSTQLPADCDYFRTTLGHCDCDAPLGETHRGLTRATDWSQEAAKLRRKGWTEAKLARALEQSGARESLKTLQYASDTQQRLQRWTQFVLGTLDSGLTPELGLLLHEYSGLLTEAFAIKRRQAVRVDASLPEQLLGMEADVLYIFRRAA